MIYLIKNIMALDLSLNFSFFLDIDCFDSSRQFDNKFPTLLSLVNIKSSVCQQFMFGKLLKWIYLIKRNLNGKCPKENISTLSHNLSVRFRINNKQCNGKPVIVRLIATLALEWMYFDGINKKKQIKFHYYMHSNIPCTYRYTSFLHVVFIMFTCENSI